MQVSKTAWLEYVKGLSSLNSKASDLVAAWIEEHGVDDKNALIDYAYAVTTKYSEASATLACEWYDAIAAAEKANVAAAVPAATATMPEVARAVNGAENIGPSVVPPAVGRFVKQSAADTTLQNAKRDGAQFAWIAMGDTCPYCLAIAANGWQYAKGSTITHADHIHNNCDCQFAVRFNSSTEIAGYNWKRYKKMYDDAPGNSAKEKVNALRRKNYAENKEEINAKKRAAYAARQERKNNDSAET